MFLPQGYTPHTSHYTRHTTHYTLHTTHDTRHATHDTRHTTHFTLHYTLSYFDPVTGRPLVDYVGTTEDMSKSVMHIKVM
jgi:hypothetical protein